MASRADEQARRKTERAEREAQAAAEAAKTGEPQCVEASVSVSAGGKLAIVDYGRHSSDWMISMTRRYAVPPEWTDAMVDDFQQERHAHLRSLVEPLDQKEYDERIDQVDWSGR
jgi:hypothetical protein